MYCDGSNEKCHSVHPVVKEALFIKRERPTPDHGGVQLSVITLFKNSLQRNYINISLVDSSDQVHNPLQIKDHVETWAPFIWSCSPVTFFLRSRLSLTQHQWPESHIGTFWNQVSEWTLSVNTPRGGVKYSAGVNAHKRRTHGCRVYSAWARVHGQIKHCATYPVTISTISDKGHLCYMSILFMWDVRRVTVYNEVDAKGQKHMRV